LRFWPKLWRSGGTTPLGTGPDSRVTEIDVDMAIIPLFSRTDASGDIGMASTALQMTSRESGMPVHRHPRIHAGSSSDEPDDDASSRHPPISVRASTEPAQLPLSSRPPAGLMSKERPLNPTSIVPAPRTFRSYLPPSQSDRSIERPVPSVTPARSGS